MKITEWIVLGLMLGIVGIAYADKLPSPIISVGTKPTASGCAFSAQSGGSYAGTYTSGTTGTCTVTLTFGLTPITGWICVANDKTTTADTQSQTADTITPSSTATISGTTVSGDVIRWWCQPY